MNRPTRPETKLPEPTINIKEGWHCLHLYYQVEQSVLNELTDEERQQGREELAEILNPERDATPERMQTSIVSGAGADLGIMMMDPNPLVIDSIMQQIRSATLGPALLPTYSFVSISEISEYVPTLDQFSEKLIREGADQTDPAFQARVTGYEKRLPMMNKQRLYPEFPELPVMSFYPMNKIRHPDANWFMKPFSSRSKMMSEHATSGIKFAGRISQLITASTGFDDWEWGVTLWGRSPEDIKEIVYTMRFDEASARYAEFGPFYISYIMSPADALAHLRM